MPSRAPHRCEACGRPIRHAESLCPACQRDLERHLLAAMGGDSPEDRPVEPAAVAVRPWPGADAAFVRPDWPDDGTAAHGTG